MSRPAGMAAAAVGASQAGGRNLFHQNGIDGLVLHRTFVNRLNDRLNTSKDQTTRVTQAFQVFATSFKGLPVAPSPGTAGPTLDSLVATLKQEVATALTRREGLSIQQTPSEQTSIKISPLAPVALVPFADAQIDKMAATLEQLPAVTGPGGHADPGRPDAGRQLRRQFHPQRHRRDQHPSPPVQSAERLLPESLRHVHPDVQRHSRRDGTRLFHPRPARDDPARRDAASSTPRIDDPFARIEHSRGFHHDKAGTRRGETRILFDGAATFRYHRDGCKLQWKSRGVTMRSGDRANRWSRIALALVLWTAVVSCPDPIDGSGQTPPDLHRKPVVPSPVHRVRAIAKLYLHASSRLSRGTVAGDLAA